MDARRRQSLGIANLAFRIFVGALSLGGAGAVVAFLVGKAPAPSVESATYEPHVQVFEVEEVEQNRQWRGYGGVKAVSEADIPARVSAIVKRRLDGMRTGAKVKKDQLLLELDDTDVQRAIDLAKAQSEQLDAQIKQLKGEEERLGKETLPLQKENVRLAQEEWDRYVDLAGTTKSVSVIEKDKAHGRLVRAKLELATSNDLLLRMPARKEQLEAQKRAADATLAMRKLDLARCKITSPLDGTLQVIDVEPGEQVTPGQRVARVVDLRKVELRMQLPASSRSEIEVGSQVTITRTGTSHIGEAFVERISPEDDPESRTVSALALIEQDVDKSDNILVPGVFATVQVYGKKLHRRLVVPRRSIRDDQVRVVRDGRVVGVEVEVDFTVNIKGRKGNLKSNLKDDQWVVLAEGEANLKKGEQILLNYAAKVRNGQKVRAVTVGAESEG